MAATFADHEVFTAADILTNGLIDEEMAVEVFGVASPGLRAYVQGLSYQTPATMVQGFLNQQGLWLCSTWTKRSTTRNGIQIDVGRMLRFATKVPDLIEIYSIAPSTEHVLRDTATQFSKMDRAAQVQPALAANLTDSKLRLLRRAFGTSALPAETLIEAIMPPDMSIAKRLGLAFPEVPQDVLMALMGSQPFAAVLRSLPSANAS
jgi:hypothetical protein